MKPVKVIKNQKIRSLKSIGRLKFLPKPPFNFRLTFWKPSHYLTGLETHSTKTTWRTFRMGDEIIVVRFRSSGNKVSGDVFGQRRLTYANREKLIARIEYAYGINESLADFQKIATKDSVLRPIWSSLKGMRISCPESIFEIAIISLLLQNTTIKRSIQMTSNLLQNYGKRVKCCDQTLKVFFNPKEIMSVTERDLRQECRLGYRAKYLPRFAEHFAKFSDDVRQYGDRNSLVSTLQQIHGVGPYTANVVASHALRDTGAIPYDVWNRRIYAKCLFSRPDVPVKKIDHEMRRRYGQFAGLAALYMIEYEYLKTPMVALISDN